MSIQRPQLLVEAADDVEDDDAEMEMTRAQIVYAQMHARGKHWPKTIGIVEIVAGFILVLLGALEVFIIPMIESKDGLDLIILDKRNCYGVGLIAGFVMVITGSTALRATMSQRNTTVYRFFNLTILSVLVYTGLTIFLIVAYAKGWTAPDKYPADSHMREVHMFVTIFMVLGLMFAISALVQYFDVICCGRDGQDPLWRHWVGCLCPCCPRGGPERWRRLSFDYSYQEELNNRSEPI
ncbi:hypothetical protein PoB_003907300 [Plakobranchus ocellatus]|uniref:Uncharacterized protein n=1 Tax=Plakobranchus ocellatus TaxID=259542 RepID=A0AAV4B1F8_9GAST|nr:hypothetical protein PoB_003907300 [Plakobranchus ocellatus]